MCSIMGIRCHTAAAHRLLLPEGLRMGDGRGAECAAPSAYVGCRCMGPQPGLCRAPVMLPLDPHGLWRER